MSTISGIGFSQVSTYRALSSGKKINSAADGAAELSIIQKENQQTGGYSAGTENAKSLSAAANIADSAIGEVTDYLQRIRELSIQASNGLNSYSDKKAIQNEIDQLVSGINNIGTSTKYNETSLLDGSAGEISAATDGNGASHSISSVNVLSSALGLDDYDVTGDFDLSVIDDAISAVSAGRSRIGAQTNSLSHSISYNSIVSTNLSSSISNTEDTEYGEYVSRLKKQEVLDQYSIFAQRERMNAKTNMARQIMAF